MSNYTLGRGELWFARYKDGTTDPEGERYIGNTPEFNLTVEEEKLDHFSSDRGIKEKDDSISLQVTRTGNLTTDEISPENLALFFFGSASKLTVVGASVDDEAINGVSPGLTYQLGTGPGAPSGHRKITVPGTGPTLLTVTDDDDEDPTTFVLGTDYTVDADLGRLMIVEGGAITEGTNLLVSYTYVDSTRDRIVSGGTAINGTLRFIAKNPKGEQTDFFFPKVTISPNGDFALKGDEWQQIPFNVEVLKKDAFEAIYLDGRAYNPA